MASPGDRLLTTIDVFRRTMTRGGDNAFEAQRERRQEFVEFVEEIERLGRDATGDQSWTLFDDDTELNTKAFVLDSGVTTSLYFKLKGRTHFVHMLYLFSNPRFRSMALETREVMIKESITRRFVHPSLMAILKDHVCPYRKQAMEKHVVTWKDEWTASLSLTRWTTHWPLV
jgi:hypothetical protein